MTSTNLKDVIERELAKAPALTSQQADALASILRRHPVEGEAKS